MSKTLEDQKIFGSFFIEGDLVSKIIRAALAQMEIIPGNPEKNAAKILKYIEQAKSHNADMILLPNYPIAGEFSGYTEGQNPFAEECREFEHEILAAADKKIRIILGDNETSKSETDPLIYVNAVGIQNQGKTFFVFNGESKIFSPLGQLVLTLPSFEESFQIFELTLEPSFSCKKIFGDSNLPNQKNPVKDQRAKIYNTLFYGTKKFLEQIKVNRVVIGVSGGIDSAIAAALYSQILGSENVLLVNMPSKFNSDTTKNLAQKLAENLGCRYEVVPIQESVDLSVNQFEKISGLDVSGFVKENIQARDRGSRILAGIAAAFNGVFTCNANKTELTIGYATLYGDCSGFFAATADLWKFQVYDIARYMNEEIFHHEVIPQGIIDIIPSAELSDAQNVDEGKGDPLHYDYHDYLFRAFVESQKTPSDILHYYSEGNLESQIGCKSGLVKKYFPTAKEFVEDLERWWNRFRGLAVAKRLQAPPLLAICDRPFGFPESQNEIYYTREYRKLKSKLLEGNS